jgi:hypothetical protein
MEEEVACERARANKNEAALAAQLQRALASNNDLQRRSEEVGDHGPFSRSPRAQRQDTGL